MSTLSKWDHKPSTNRHALRVSGLALAVLSFQTLGTVFLFPPRDPCTRQLTP
jgi:hypothetical protein